MKNTFKIGLGLASAALALSLSLSAQAKDWKTVTIAMEGAYEPWNLTDPSGKIVGFEVDLVNDLCKRMKVECKIITQDWDGMIPGLQAGKFDVIMDGMSITEERLKTIDFSKPYAQTPASLVVNKTGPLAKLPGTGTVINLSKDAAGGEAAIKALQAAVKGKTIGVQVSTIHATFADKYFKDVAIVREYKTTDEHDADLMAGRLDAVLADVTAEAPVLAKPEAKDLMFAGTQFSAGPIFGAGVGMGIRKADADLTKMFNEAMDASFKDGSVKKMSLDWFKIDTAP